MVGYSDSCKDGGYLANNWTPRRRPLAATAKQHGIGLVLFHGRGGSQAEAAGPRRAAYGRCPRGRRLQGPHHRAGRGPQRTLRRPEVAFRHVEQVAWATLLVSTRARTRSTPLGLSNSPASEASTACYRALGDPGFLAYFDKHADQYDRDPTHRLALPVAAVGRELKDLRTIPYTFAWTQNRHLLTGWYGLGMAYRTSTPTHASMFAGWPMFRGMIC